MIKNKLEKIENKLFKSDNRKKNIENLIVFIVMLIIAIIAINTIWRDDGEAKEEYKEISKVEEKEISNIVGADEYNLEDELEDILSKIVGIGKVKVLVTYSETSEIVAMYNENYSTSTTEETDSEGGIRKLDQTDVNREIIFEDSTEGNKPITQKVILPKIEGAVIAAQGASNPNVKATIIEAVAAVTGLPAYKIQVFEFAS